MFLRVCFDIFSRGIFAEKGRAMQEQAQISMENIESPKMSASTENSVPMRMNVRHTDVMREAPRQSGVARLQKLSVISAEYV